MVRERAKELKRSAILAAAGKLLSRRRFVDISLQDVAEAADVAKGTLYLYYRDKEALYLAYTAMISTPLMERLRVEVPAAARVSTLNAIAGMLQAAVDFSRRNPVLQDIIESTTRASQDTAKGHIRREVRQLLLDAIQAGIDRGELRDLDPAMSADVILSVIPRLLQRCSGKQRGDAPERSIEHLMDLLQGGLIVHKSVKNRAREIA